MDIICRCGDKFQLILVTEEEGLFECPKCKFNFKLNVAKSRKEWDYKAKK